MDLRKFEDWLLTEKHLALTTARKTLEHVRFMLQRAGLQEPFTVDAGRAFLAQRARVASDDAYNGDVRALNNLAEHLLGQRPFSRRRPPRRTYKYLLPDQVRAVLAYRHPAREVQLRRRALALMALKTGMRSSELTGMLLEDLDPSRSRFYVRRPAKGGPRRWLPVESWVFSPTRPLMAYLSWRAKHARSPHLWVARPEGFGHGRRYARRRGPARPLTEAALRKDLRELGRSVGVQLNCTITRHTRGTELSDPPAGWGVQFIQHYLGHATPTSTMIYVAVRQDSLRDLMRKRPGRDFFQGGRP